MNDKQAKSESQGVRLSVEHWPKFRAVMQAHGRRRLEQWIDREYRNLSKRRKVPAILQKQE